MAAPFTYPLAAGTYRLTSGYRTPERPTHRGIDLAAPLKTPIYAAANGMVADSRGALAAGRPGWVGGFGGWIVLDHTVGARKVSTVYGHMYPADLLVGIGEKVMRGQLIARVGNNGDDTTGAHCHFEVWEGGRLTGGHDVNPALYLDPAPAPNPEELTVTQYDDLTKQIAELRAVVMGALIGGNSPGRNNFNYLDDKIAAVSDKVTALADKVAAQQAK
jgi:murein DD-endopeptidase MepM/ murein hydrolase activator NlpD